jgi:hypothetical protein
MSVFKKCQGCGETLTGYKEKYCKSTCQRLRGGKPRTKNQLATRKRMANHYNDRLQNGGMNWEKFLKEINEIL